MLDINKTQTLGEQNLQLFIIVYLFPKTPQRSYRMHFCVYRDAHTHYLYIYYGLSNFSTASLLANICSRCYGPR